jgi:hypothetical protein
LFADITATDYAITREYYAINIFARIATIATPILTPLRHISRQITLIFTPDDRQKAISRRRHYRYFSERRHIDGQH